MTNDNLNKLVEMTDGALEATPTKVTVKDAAKLRNVIEKLVYISATGKGSKAMTARYLVRGAALDLGIVPSSIHDLYIGRGKGEVPNTFTVPAMNLRVLTFEAAKAVFRSAKKINAASILFEIARSEIGYTDQRPTEYMTSVLGAAIAEEFSGPVFVQGDHFQISAGRYAANPDQEVQAVLDLSEEAIHAGFYNIDVDTSTLVDLDKDTIEAQQELNTTLSSKITAKIREFEPEGITISVGGEIGEVGGQNSTEEELRAYTDGFNAKLAEIDPDMAGLSKISIQTGTSHGGVVLPDGTIAQVSVDFDTLLRLSKVARDEYGMAGAVQHGASTLPQDAFGKFVESEACEVHLATNFQNIFYDLAPEDLVAEIYKYLDENHQNERKPDMTDDQFYYKTRKRALGAFKKQILDLPSEAKAKVSEAWEKQFSQLFDSLSIAGTKEFVDAQIKPVAVLPPLSSFLDLVSEDTQEEDTSDLAD
jgi:fructose/tagatose bisphosphate aldolase